MSSRSLRIILVTGAPRSGTTIVGECLSFPKSVGTLHEPFNAIAGLKKIDRYFQIPGTVACSDQQLDQYVKEFQNLNLQFKPGVFPKERGIRRLAKKLFGGRAINSYRLVKLNPFLSAILWKDPFASFTAPYLCKSPDLDIVLTLRNPWAVCASFKRMHWAFDISEIYSRLEQAGYNYKQDVESVWQRRNEPAINGALLWYAIYKINHSLSPAQGNFNIINIDDIIADPLQSYHDLYDRLKLPWDDSIAEKINKKYNNSKSRSIPQESRVHDRNRDLQSINKYWKEILNDDEYQVISQIVSDLWDSYQSTDATNKTK